MNNKPHHHNTYRTLSSGIDTFNLVLSIKLKKTKYKDLLHDLDGLFSRATSLHKPQVFKLYSKKYEAPLVMELQHHGSVNYQYILKSPDYTIRVSTSQDSKHNVYIEIRSITLWTLGYKNAVDRVLDYLGSYAYPSISKMVSRSDLCADLEIHEEDWLALKDDCIVCPTSKITLHKNKSTGEIETISTGKGKIRISIYDKVREIKEHSDKKWMYEVWGVNEPRPGYRIIRIEFRIRIDGLKTFGIKSLTDFYESIGALWSYLTKKWFKILVRPEKNKDRQKVLFWWEAVQNAFGENVQPLPRVRQTAVRMEQDQQARMTLAYITNLRASLAADEGFSKDTSYPLRNCLDALEEQLNDLGITDDEITEIVRKKILKYLRIDDIPP